MLDYDFQIHKHSPVRITLIGLYLPWQVLELLWWTRQRCGEQVTGSFFQSVCKRSQRGWAISDFRKGLVGKGCEYGQPFWLWWPLSVQPKGMGVSTSASFSSLGGLNCCFFSCQYCALTNCNVMCKTVGVWRKIVKFWWYVSLRLQKGLGYSSSNTS